jgi:RecJ-like exonuclease
MITDSCERGEWDVLQAASGEFTVFSGDGYSVTLAPSGAIVGYSAIHRDRCWHQVRAGIRSRVSRKRGIRPNTDRDRSASGVPTAEAISGLEPGMAFFGRVESVASFGFFVEIDGVVGLLHRSQIGDTANLPELNDVIRVVVDNVDLERMRVALIPAPPSGNHSPL